MNRRLLRLPLATEGLSVTRESVLAEPTEQSQEYKVCSIPAFIYGLGVGDVVRVLDSASGRFTLVSRGGQITIRVFVNGSLDRPDIKSLVEAVVAASGSYEVGKNDRTASGTSLLLISLDASLGFPRIEYLMRQMSGSDIQWEYGNVYDSAGNPLDWWQSTIERK